MNRRDVVAGFVSAMIGTNAIAAGRNPITRRMSRTIGFNLISWNENTNTNPASWISAVRFAFEVGARRVSFVPYAFVDRSTGEIFSKSRQGLTIGPTQAAIAPAAKEAVRLGLSVSIKPLVEIDNAVGEGAIWRGTIELSSELQNVFFTHYCTYILQMAEMARAVRASRFYIGSELEGLTKDPSASGHWRKLIADCRAVFSEGQACLLTYASNFTEYEKVSFWPQLDEVGIDAYFPLATAKTAQGLQHPTTADIADAWDHSLEKMRRFSARVGRPVLLAEWGVVPFDMTTAEPSQEHPSSLLDESEAIAAYQAVLPSVAKAKQWLKGIDLWHLQVDPDDDSPYRIEQSGNIARVIRDAVRQ